MAQSLPWSVKGIDANTRDAAREAARRAGMSVSDWLEHVIREETRKGAAAEARYLAPEPDLSRGDDLSARLRMLGRHDAGTVPERPAGRTRTASPRRDEVDLLLDHAAKLETRTRDQEIKTTTALESIIGWIEKAESRMAASEQAAAERQERTTSVIADAIKTVSSRVSDVERRSQAAAQAPYPQQSERHAENAGPSGSVRRPVLSRDNLAHAVSDIQMRQRSLDQATGRNGPSTVMQTLRSEGAHPSETWQPERRVGERRADVTPLMNSLRTDLAQLRSEISSLSQQPASSQLEASIRDLAMRLDGRGPSSLDELAKPLARIEAELSRLQAQDPTNRFTSIETEIMRLGNRIETLAESAHEPRILAAAVQELNGLKNAIAGNNQAPRLDDLSRQIATLAHDMGRVREEISRHNTHNDVESAIEDMREALMRETRDANGIGHGLLTRIAQQLESVSAAVSDVPASGMADSDRQQLALLSHKLDQLAQRTQPESDALAQRIEELAIKLDDMSDRRSPELIERVERLSEQIDMLARRGPAAIEKQIDTLTDRIEALAKTQARLVVPAGTTSVDLAPLEDMIGDLARKIEAASKPDASTSGLQALEKQITALANRLDTKPAAATHSHQLEATLQDLMRSLGGLRDETAHAVERAAKAAVADAMTQMPAAVSPPDLSSLRSDLAGLKDVHVSIDKRTNTAIGAVNDTLEKIVQRLAQLEDDITRDRPFDSAPVSPMTAMPQRRVNEPENPSPAPHAPAAPLSAESFEHPRVRREPALEQIATMAAAPTRDAIRDIAPSMQRAVRQPVASQPTPVQPAAGQPMTERDHDVDPLLDVPLEPGSGRPRHRGEASEARATQNPAIAPGAVNPNLIAAARRAAIAASAEAEALKAEDKKASKTSKLPKIGLPLSLKETLEKRRKPILLGLAAIVLALGAGQIASTMLNDSPATEQAKPVASREQTEARSLPSSAATGDDASRQGSTGSAPASQPQLPKDQTSLSAPSPGQANLNAAVETTGSVKTAPVDMAALAPATLSPHNAAPDATRFSAAPGLVTNLGELPATIGTAGLRRAASEGNANAVYELGVRATEGVGTVRDHRLALRLFERAAAAGFAPAQFRLANMHEKGIGTGRDASLAMTWYRRAAEKGNSKAMHNLAVLIAEGADGKPDYSEAARLFRKAAEFGVRDSQFNLAILLGRGLGVEQDMAQSYTWFAVAARQGDADAAKKRDEVGVRLSAVDLAAARNASLTWKPTTPDPVANEVAAPSEGWDPAPRQPQPRTPPKQRAT